MYPRFRSVEQSVAQSVAQSRLSSSVAAILLCQERFGIIDESAALLARRRESHAIREPTLPALDQHSGAAALLGVTRSGPMRRPTQRECPRVPTARCEQADAPGWRRP